MARVYNTVQIQMPIEQVFDYATTPGNWPRWHPSSLGVSGATDHSLKPGEQVTERFLVAGRRGTVVWTVREREAPRRWVIESRTESGGSGKITYALTPRDGGTAFEREFVYSMPNAMLALLDRVVFRRRIEAESAEALRRLKEVLERRAA
ncbi:MAG TPA: SRPBCC family protein [Rubrobacteraceae bacterium]|nr:SRPBCC family protein [Rubrobacteraceae bacterium]